MVEGVGDTGTDVGTSKALTNTAGSPDVDAVVADIIANYATDGQYRSGMTQAQIDAVINF